MDRGKGRWLEQKESENSCKKPSGERINGEKRWRREMEIAGQKKFQS